MPTTAKTKLTIAMRNTSSSTPLPLWSSAPLTTRRRGTFSASLNTRSSRAPCARGDRQREGERSARRANALALSRAGLRVEARARGDLGAERRRDERGVTRRDDEQVETVPAVAEEVAPVAALRAELDDELAREHDEADLGTCPGRERARETCSRGFPRARATNERRRGREARGREARGRERARARTDLVDAAPQAHLADVVGLEHGRDADEQDRADDDRREEPVRLDLRAHGAEAAELEAAERRLARPRLAPPRGVRGARAVVRDRDAPPRGVGERHLRPAEPWRGRGEVGDVAVVRPARRHDAAARVRRAPAERGEAVRERARAARPPRRRGSPGGATPRRAARARARPPRRPRPPRRRRRARSRAPSTSACSGVATSDGRRRGRPRPRPRAAAVRAGGAPRPRAAPPSRPSPRLRPRRRRAVGRRAPACVRSGRRGGPRRARAAAACARAA